MIYIFDTDHLSLYQRTNPVIVERIRTLNYDLDDLATTIINYHEQLSGRFEQVKQAKNSAEVVKAYQLMKGTIDFWMAGKF
jgi:tRNA(fMet)-specific endonuclease VapC